MAFLPPICECHWSPTQGLRLNFLRRDCRCPAAYGKLSAMIETSLKSLLESHVRVLCETERNTGNCPEGLERAEKYLRGAFQGLGYEVTRQEFRAGRVPCANVEALPPGFVGVM